MSVLGDFEQGVDGCVDTAYRLRIGLASHASKASSGWHPAWILLECGPGRRVSAPSFRQGAGGLRGRKDQWPASLVQYAKDWDVATGTAPLPASRPPTDDAFWTSEFFDFGVDPYEKSDPYCADWEPLLDTRRYANQSPYSFVDGHVKVLPFSATCRSLGDNMWDLH